MKAGKTHEWIIVLGDTAAWAWPLFASPAAPRRFAADAEGHAALLRCLGESHGEAHSRVLIDLACETLHEQHTPALRWHDRRALAQQCQRNQFAADALVGWRWRPGLADDTVLQLCGVPMQGSLPAWLHLLTHGAAPPVALYSASWLGEPLARTLGASHGPALLLQPGLASARLSWLQDGRVRHSRQVGPAGEDISLVLDFFASQPDYPAHGIPTLWQTGEDDSLVHHPALAGFQRQQAPLESGWPDWLSAQLSRQPGDYRWPPGTSRPQLGQCSPRSRRLTLAISLAAAVLGGGWFAWGEALNRQAAQLAEHTRALHASNQQLAASLGPAEVTQARRAALNSLLILRTRWPRLGDDLDALAEQLARRPALSVTALHWRADPARLSQGSGAHVQLELRADATLSARQALAELEQLLAACRQAGWNATLSHAPFDTRAEATLHSQSEEVVRFVVQLALPARKAGQ